MRTAFTWVNIFFIFLGYDKSFSKNFRKIKSNFSNSMIIGFLKSLKNINEFEEIVIMEDGEIKEKGPVEKLVLDKDVSTLSNYLVVALSQVKSRR